jgi:hypothetical protein
MDKSGQHRHIAGCRGRVETGGQDIRSTGLRENMSPYSPGDPSSSRESNTLPPAASSAPLNQSVDLVLHIGAGKTGTSSIQHLLKRNRARLAELGTLVPRTPGNLRHTELGMYIKRDAVLRNRLNWHTSNYSSPAQFREGFRRRLAEEISDSALSRVLLSDEGVYASSEEAMTRLRELVGDIARSLRLVVYLRRQDDHACSRYQQSVKTGCVQRLSEWIRDDMTGLYDYATRLSEFDRVLAPHDLVVRRFERESFVDGSLLQDFLDAAGIDVRATDLEPVPDRNQSLDADSVEFLRLLNLHRVEGQGSTPGLIDNRGTVQTLMKASSGPTLTLPDATLDTFMAQWEESNRTVAENHLGDPGGRLFRAPRKTRNTTTEQRLDPDRLPYFFQLLELPERKHAPIRRLAEREASSP